jgi:hypothetical protein
MLDVKSLPPRRIRGGEVAQMRILELIGMRGNCAPFIKRRIQLRHGE